MSWSSWLSTIMIFQSSSKKKKNNMNIMYVRLKMPYSNIWLSSYRWIICSLRVSLFSWRATARRKRVVIGSGKLCALVYVTQGTPFQRRFNVSKALSVARLVLKLIFFRIVGGSQETIGCHLHIHAYPI